MQFFIILCVCVFDDHHGCLVLIMWCLKFISASRMAIASDETRTPIGRSADAYMNILILMWAGTIYDQSDDFADCSTAVRLK